VNKLFLGGGGIQIENNNDVKTFYEEVDEDGRVGWELLEYVRSKEIISRYIDDTIMEIADISGGTGAYSFWLAGMGHRVHLLDLAQKHIDIAKARSKDINIPLASCSCSDARSIPYDDQSMDLVLLMGALYHLKSDESRIQCLTEAFRVLKPGRLAICTVMSRYNGLIAAFTWDLVDSFGGMDALKNALETGSTSVAGPKMPLFYSHTPSGIITEMSVAGFKDIHLIAVEGIASAIGDKRNILPEDKKSAMQLLKAIEMTESVPDILGISRNIIAVGKKV